MSGSDVPGWLPQPFSMLCAGMTGQDALSSLSEPFSVLCADDWTGCAVLHPEPIKQPLEG